MAIPWYLLTGDASPGSPGFAAAGKTAVVVRFDAFARADIRVPVARSCHGGTSTSRHTPPARCRTV